MATSDPVDQHPVPGRVEGRRDVADQQLLSGGDHPDVVADEGLLRSLGTGQRCSVTGAPKPRTRVWAASEAAA